MRVAGSLQGAPPALSPQERLTYGVPQPWERVRVGQCCLCGVSVRELRQEIAAQVRWAMWMEERMLSSDQIAAFEAEPEEAPQALPKPTRKPHLSDPFDRAEFLINSAARKVYGVDGLVVDLKASPAGPAWIGCPAGFVLARRLGLPAPEIAATIAKEASRACPCNWGQEVRASGGYVNVRWA